MEKLAAEHLRATMVAYRDLLRRHQERLNRLNVYPVPDGDTGTNMALTLESVVAGSRTWRGYWGCARPANLGCWGAEARR